jgi:hypothetical protein
MRSCWRRSRSWAQAECVAAIAPHWRAGFSSVRGPSTACIDRTPLTQSTHTRTPFKCEGRGGGPRCQVRLRGEARMVEECGHSLHLFCRLHAGQHYDRVRSSLITAASESKLDAMRVRVRTIGLMLRYDSGLAEISRVWRDQERSCVCESFAESGLSSTNRRSSCRPDCSAFTSASASRRTTTLVQTVAICVETSRELPRQHDTTSIPR